MERFRLAVSQRPLVVFFLLAYVLSWWTAPVAGGALLPHGPFLAAIIVVGWQEGWRGVSTFLGRVFRWRTGWQWLLVAPALVLAYLAVAIGLHLLLGATITSTAHLADMGGRTLSSCSWVGGRSRAGPDTPCRRFRRASPAGVPACCRPASLLGVLRGVWHIPWS